MKVLEKLSSRIAKSASTTVKEEVKGAAIDVLPTLIGIGGMIFGIVLFKHRADEQAAMPGSLSKYSSITITTNNYYFGDNFAKMHQEEEDER